MDRSNMKHIMFSLYDVTFWSKRWKDHAKFIHTLTGNEDIGREAYSLYLALERILPTSYETFDRINNIIELILDDVSQQGYVCDESKISSNDYTALVDHMKEELWHVDALMSNDITDDEIIAFWRNNFLEHFTLLTDTWPMEANGRYWRPLFHECADRFTEVINGINDEVGFREFIRNSNTSLSILHNALETIREYKYPMKLLDYKMTQHERKEMVFAVRQLMTLPRNLG